MPVEAGSGRISRSGSLVREITGPVRNRPGKLPAREIVTPAEARCMYTWNE